MAMAIKKMIYEVVAVFISVDGLAYECSC